MFALGHGLRGTSLENDILELHPEVSKQAREMEVLHTLDTGAAQDTPGALSICERLHAIHLRDTTAPDCEMKQGVLDMEADDEGFELCDKEWVQEGGICNTTGSESESVPKSGRDDDGEDEEKSDIGI